MNMISEEMKLNRNDAKMDFFDVSNEGKLSKSEEDDAMIIDHERNVLEGYHLMDTVNMFDNRKYDEIQVECLDANDLKIPLAYKKDFKKVFIILSI